MNRDKLSKCWKCGEISALREDVACRFCRLALDRNHHEQALAEAFDRVTEIQDTLIAIAQEQASYRVQVERATNGGGFSPEYVAMMNDTYKEGN